MKVTLILIFAAALFLCSCHRSSSVDFIPKESQNPTTPPSSESEEPEANGSQLLYLTENPEEAARIAELYGIVLVRHFDGLAVYRTEEDPLEVIRRGRENGWPEISFNQPLYPY